MLRFGDRRCDNRDPSSQFSRLSVVRPFMMISGAIARGLPASFQRPLRVAQPWCGADGSQGACRSTSLSAQARIRSVDGYRSTDGPSAAGLGPHYEGCCQRWLSNWRLPPPTNAREKADAGSLLRRAASGRGRGETNPVVCGRGGRFLPTSAPKGQHYLRGHSRSCRSPRCVRRLSVPRIDVALAGQCIESRVDDEAVVSRACRLA